MNPLYEEDFYAWSLNQAEHLKKREFEMLDFEHLIEEIDALGRREKNTLGSYFEILLMHMLKTKYQPSRHSRSWDLSIKNSRTRIRKCLRENPCLKHHISEIYIDSYESSRLDAAIETGLDEEVFPKECPWTIEEVLGE